MRLSPFTLAVLLIAPFATHALAGPAAPALPDYLADVLEARGVDAHEASQATVERTVFGPAGASSTRAMPLREWLGTPEAAVWAGPVALATAPLGDVVVGSPSHAMLQLSCVGYGAREVVGDVSTVEGVWDVGLHVVIHPAQSGAAVGSASPASSYVRIDTGATAAGALVVTEDRLMFLGFCLALAGSMTGPGVYSFDG